MHTVPGTSGCRREGERGGAGRRGVRQSEARRADGAAAQRSVRTPEWVSSLQGSPCPAVPHTTSRAQHPASHQISGKGSALRAAPPDDRQHRDAGGDQLAQKLDPNKSSRLSP